MMKVTEMTELILMPMSWLVSKSLATARMAMPTLVRLISWVRARTRRMTSTGVTTVTHLVGAPRMVTDSERKGREGYIWGRPPVM